MYKLCQHVAEKCERHELLTSSKLLNKLKSTPMALFSETKPLPILEEPSVAILQVEPGR